MSPSVCPSQREHDRQKESTCPVGIPMYKSYIWWEDKTSSLAPRSHHPGTTLALHVQSCIHIASVPSASLPPPFPLPLCLYLSPPPPSPPSITPPFLPTTTTPSTTTSTTPSPPQPPLTSFFDTTTNLWSVVGCIPGREGG